MPRTLIPLLAMTAALAAGCGTPADSASTRAQDTTEVPTTTPPSQGPSVPSKPYTVEELAATVGCTPEFQGKAADFRKALCHTDGIDYLLLDFAAADGQRAWLDTATMYGGVYLVGERWVLSASTRDRMVELGRTLGGAIEESPMNGNGGR